MEIKTVQSAVPESYEGSCHETDIPAFCLDLRRTQSLQKARLERAIGVIYRPETELASHYFQAVLTEQFNEYIWFDRTKAVSPFATKELEEMPDTYPFGL